jgi:hypothetical protein
MSSAPLRPSVCSWPGREAQPADQRHPKRSRRPPGSVGTSMGYRSRSSWRPLAQRPSFEEIAAGRRPLPVPSHGGGHRPSSDPPGGHGLELRALGRRATLLDRLSVFAGGFRSRRCGRLPRAWMPTPTTSLGGWWKRRSSCGARRRDPLPPSRDVVRQYAAERLMRGVAAVRQGSGFLALAVGPDAGPGQLRGLRQLDADINMRTASAFAVCVRRRGDRASVRSQRCGRTGMPWPPGGRSRSSRVGDRSPEPPMAHTRAIFGGGSSPGRRRLPSGAVLAKLLDAAAAADSRSTSTLRTAPQPRHARERKTRPRSDIRSGRSRLLGLDGDHDVSTAQLNLAVVYSMGEDRRRDSMPRRPASSRRIGSAEAPDLPS